MGIYVHCSHQTIGLMMAFGAGTLIFAVAVEEGITGIGQGQFACTPVRENAANNAIRWNLGIVGSVQMNAHVACYLFGGLLSRVSTGAADYIDVTIQFSAALLGASTYMQLNKFALQFQLRSDHRRQSQAQGIFHFGE
eukprot:5832254-Pyramimonas_sp.AAC.1